MVLAPTEYPVPTPSGPKDSEKTVQSRLVLTDGPPLDSEAPLTQQVVDTQHSVVSAVSHAQSTRRNQPSGVSSLPTEILLLIFGLLQDMSPAVHATESPLGWIVVTHVCQRWRSIAVDAPCLWRYINSGVLGHDWIHRMLDRAREVPTTIVWMLDKDAAEDQADLDLISRHLHHTRYLGLCGRAPILLCWLNSQSFSQTMLETLELDGSYLYHPNNIAPNLPEALVRARLPDLTVVSLTGLCIPWKAPILSGLVRLEIQMMEYDGPDASTTSTSYDNAPYDDLLSALERMPTLHALLLENCLPRRSPKATRNVHLPHLNSLSLLGLSHSVIEIFRHLTIPPRCQLQLHCVDGEDADPEAIEGIIPALAAHFGAGHGASPFQWLEISGPWAGQYYIDAWRPETAADALPVTHLADFSIHVPCTERPQESLASLCSSRPFRAVRTISVEPEDIMVPILPAEAWREILGHCAEIRHATLQGIDAVTFCAALGAPFTAAGNKLDDFVLLSKLECLRLDNVAFDYYGLVDGETAWYHMLLWDRLVQRNEVSGLPRLSLSFADCALPSDLKPALEGLDSIVCSWIEDQEDSDEL